MPNNNPVRTEEFTKHNYQSYGGDELNLPLGSKPFSTRMPIDVEEVLLAMNPKERVVLIRTAVVKAVRARQKNSELNSEITNYELVSAKTKSLNK